MKKYYLLALLGLTTYLVLGLTTYLGAADVDTSTLHSSRKSLSDKVYPTQSISQIAFGSCNKPKKDQGFWDVIRSKQPDIMLLLGDNHYAESTNPKKLKKAYDFADI